MWAFGGYNAVELPREIWRERILEVPVKCESFSLELIWKACDASEYVLLEDGGWYDTTMVLYDMIAQIESETNLETTIPLTGTLVMSGTQ